MAATRTLVFYYSANFHLKRVENAILAIKFYRYGYCLSCKPCPNTPTNGLVDDWVVLLATAPAPDNIFVYWGPTYTSCDPNTIQGTCSDQGIVYTKGDDNQDSAGFTYGYNVQLQKWTIEKFVVNRVTVPGTNHTGYETFIYESVTVEDGAIFEGGKPVACTKEITINPMLRRIRWVLLDTDQNQSYRLVMSCENMDGFLYNGYPQIQLLVKRSAIDKFKASKCKELAIYEKLSEVLAKQSINIDSVEWQIIQQNRTCPNEVVFNSIKWETCKCQISGTPASFKSAVRGYY
ncbi:hypothetical protein M8J75_000956 [Diaphorina citri]|nr:hypothetical protein M8J75_000956 [Diaphorina citri]